MKFTTPSGIDFQDDQQLPGQKESYASSGWLDINPGNNKSAFKIADAADITEKEAENVAQSVGNENIGSAALTGASSALSSAASSLPGSFSGKLESAKSSAFQQPEESLQQEMKKKTGADFSQAKIHAGPEAEALSEQVNAKAFTSGNDIFLGAGQSVSDRQLISHELTHHAQQQKSSSPGLIQRTPALYPFEPHATTLGYVSPGGGLTDDAEIQRASAIVDPQTTIRSIAALILPWFNNAQQGDEMKVTPPALTEEQLARALLVYNMTYLPVTDNKQYNMSRYHDGFRFPLPVVITRDDRWMVNPFQVQSLANTFEDKWQGLLDQLPAAAEVLNENAQQKAVDDFLAENADNVSLGIRLSAKILINPKEALPFVRELVKRDTFGPGQAIAVSSQLVKHQAELLASLQEGYEILALLNSKIAAAPNDMDALLLEEKARSDRFIKPLVTPTVTVTDNSVYPRGTATDANEEYTTISYTGLPPGMLVQPLVEPVPYSGGHDHHNNARPRGVLIPASVNTGRTNKADFRFRSNTIGGEENVTLNVGGQQLQTTIRVEVPGFVELQAGANYDLTGDTDQHNSPHNHFGTPATIAALQNIADEWEQYKADNNHPNWPRIGYNDISLPMGGLFDIDADWTPSHHEHRLGRNVDFRLGYTSEQRTVLRQIITRNGASIFDEGNHWHLRF